MLSQPKLVNNQSKKTVENGLNKAKEVVEFFKKANDKYAESIKMEAELSIDKLNSLQKNSSEEMNEYVKNYNINL